MPIQAPPPRFLAASTVKDRPMEDGDSDAEMADYGTDFQDDVDPNFDAKARPRRPGPHWATGRFRLPLLGTLRSRGRQMAAAGSLSRTLPVNRSRITCDATCESTGMILAAAAAENIYSESTAVDARHSQQHAPS
jgi:hypothetical protein